MKLFIDYNSSKPSTIEVLEDFDPLIWNRVKSIIIENQGSSIIWELKIETEWATLLSSISSLKRLSRLFPIQISYSEPAKKLITKYIAERRSVQAANGTQKISLTQEEISHELIKKGFTERVLKNFQNKDVSILSNLAHGANFSVPGAGKTTVTLASHILTKSEDTKLLVVSPKNAFSAWDKVITDCMDKEHSDMYKFTRLNGGYKNIQKLLKNNSNCYIIGYDQLRNCKSLIFEFLSTNKVHMVLDESHKMKSGYNSQTGTALLQLAHLPIRKDILSGTPIPRAISDLESQMEFLWPGQGFSKRLKNTNINSVLSGLYTRTTKKDLQLAPAKKIYIDVEMSDAQLALYSISRKEFLKRAVGIKSKSNIDISKTRKSVMQILQISSNPILLVNKKTRDDPYNFPYDDPNIEVIFKAIQKEKDSQKIKKACSLAREITENDKTAKIVIWSAFTYNVERIAHLLSDLGAVFIHGGINTGVEDDINTREGRIKEFHENPDCKVLVANPAACSEGISLHEVCHNAIYVDRSYNACHYLQSIDRIHRLGLPDDVETNIYILESIAPQNLGSIDHSVRTRTTEKIKIMDSALDDDDLKQLLLDEDGDFTSEPDILIEDILDIISVLTPK